MIMQAESTAFFWNIILYLEVAGESHGMLNFVKNSAL